MNLTTQFRQLIRDLRVLVVNRFSGDFTSHELLTEVSTHPRLSRFYSFLLTRYRGDHQKLHAQFMRLVGKFAALIGVRDLGTISSLNIRGNYSMVHRWEVI